MTLILVFLFVFFMWVVFESILKFIKIILPNYFFLQKIIFNIVLPKQINKMEKVKVKTCIVKKQGVKGDKKWTIYEVTLEDGRKGDSFDEMKEGQEYEIE